ncbi:MAG: family 78 glycoside hydrolase catalytic domain [Prevotella sp.]|nr:family 78 glycoside hydrolase catalytic domain [Prevotella sp.]
MNSLLVILLAMLPLSASAAKKKVVKPDVSVGNLCVENLDNPLGIDTAEPRFSWQIASDKQNVRQTAYQIIVNDDNGEIWNTDKIDSDQQLWIPYAGKKLQSNTHCTWRVKVWTTAGESEWSNHARFSIGLLDEGKWSGYWIGLERLLPGEERGMHTRMAARYLRKDFQLKDKEIKRATAYVAGIGLHEFYVNGQRMGDGVLQPVPSDYRKTIYYNTYDITESIEKYPLMCEGAGKCLCLGIVLGNGRYFPMQQHKPYKIHTFGYPKCRINVIVEYTDGTTQRLQTDDKGWKITADGPIRANNEYDGEEYDARKEMLGWSDVGSNTSKWLNAERTDIPQAYLRAQMTPGMKMLQQITPQSLKGNIIDIGQNIAGWLKVRVRGQKGDTIRIVYAEKLNADGTLYRDNFRNARSTDIYICNGDEGQNGRWWRPTFVYHGFKYAEVIGLKNATKDDFVAEVVADEMLSTGQFECSDTILNKVMKNAWWGILDNYKGMPLDCPQRDERQPWLGDRTIGALGESFLFDNERLYTKWMRDICEAQRTDGCIPDVAPAFWNYYSDDVAWAAALPFSCDMLWRQYGNREAIERCYPYIKKWVQHIIEEYSRDGIIHCGKYADWCVPPEKLDLIHSQDPARKTDVTLISTAYIIRTMQLMEQWGCEADYWRPIREQMARAFNKKFLTVKRGTSPRPGHVLYPDSVFYGNNTVTANILPLAIGIVPDDCKDDVIKNVVENICVQNKHHVSCGVIGISWLLRGLSDNGFPDVAYRLATNKTYPSWGYMTENGATTIWELWNGDKANPKMNSGNHVMLLGDLLTWCYQYLGGIRSADAYKHIILKPAFDIQDCEWTNVSYDSPYGTIKSHWKKTLQHLDWDVTVPSNTTADVCLPNGETKTIGSGSYHFSVDIPSSHPAIVKDEFLYTKAPFPEAHASTIVETKKGDLVVAYFGGTKERNPDVCIWVSRKPKGADVWSAPMMVADGVFPEGRHACWNPVLYEMPDGELWLFFKIGPSVSEWTGWLTKSKDGGKTWSKREPLPDGFLGPIKNKPELINGRLLCPSSTEDNGWRFHMEIYDLKTKQWKYVPVESTEAIKTDDNQLHPIDCIQPSIMKLKDGRLQVLMRTHNAHIATSYSSDNGNTWTAVTLLDIENNQSGTDAVTLQDGRHVLIYNNFETLPLTKKGVRTPCSIALSDDGTHWHHALTLEDSPIDQYSYPAIIQGRDGTLHCVYTWRRQRIAYKQIDLSKLK